MQAELAALGNDHLAIKVDLRDPAAVQELLSTLRARYGGLHILINNIERGGMPVVHGPYTPEQWELEMATTLRAKWWVMRFALPLLRESAEGAVITLSSIAGIVGRSGPAGLIFNDGYSAANRAVSSFTETWAREGAPAVRVNELMLGIFETRHGEQTRGWDLLSAEQQTAIRDHILLQRTGRIEEIVAAVFFLLRDATYMTGAVLRLDGGYVLGGEKIPPMPSGVE
jgi:3-oxoacyl-[acyl-carrier protein] reductase